MMVALITANMQTEKQNNCEESKTAIGGGKQGPWLCISSSCPASLMEGCKPEPQPVRAMFHICA